MSAPSTDELFKLDVETRLRLIDELWESVLRDLNDPANPRSVAITDEVRVLLDRRAGAYHANPGAGRSWSDVRERILKRR